MTARPRLIARLIRWQAAAMAGCFAVLISWLCAQMVLYENGDLDKRMTYFAEILAETTASAGVDPRQSLQQLRAVENIFVKGIIETLGDANGYTPTYDVLDHSGEVIYRSSAIPLATLHPNAGFADVSFGDQSFRSVRVQSGNGAISVIVAESTRVRVASVLPMLQIIGLGQLIIFLVCVLALWWAAQRSFRPVMALAAQIGARPTGDLTPVANEVTYAEIAPLIDSLNALLKREGDRLDSERGFLAEAAHELRTPLAAIALQAEHLASSTTEAARTKSADELRVGVMRVSHLLKQLLTIARVDASAAFSAISEVDAAETIRRCMADHALAAKRKSIQLELDAPDRLVVMTSSVGLVSVFDNLLDNAVKYTPAGGSVLVQLCETEAGVELTVADDDPGIDPLLRERVFERFFRIPGTEQPGSGLGLSIVKKIASAQGAAVKLNEGLRGRGLAVQLSLKRA